MPIIATDAGGEKILIPEGNHIAICYRMVYMGTVESEYQGDKKQLKKVQLSWEFPTETHVFKEENGAQPFTLHQTYTLSLGDKANLRRDLQAWRGKPFTEDEAKGFDIEAVLGAPCMLQVATKVKETGGKISIMQSIASVPKGIEVPQRINNLFKFNVEEFDAMAFELLPEWMQKEIKATPEYRILEQGEAPAPTEDEAAGTEKVADDLPF